MFRGSAKSTDYPLHSPVSPSLPLPCVTVCHHISTEVYCSLIFHQQLSALFLHHGLSSFHLFLGPLNFLLPLGVCCCTKMENRVSLVLAIGYLFTEVVFPHDASGPYTCTQKARTVICIRRNNTDHRKRKIENGT
jgi:hypothetical protein